MPRRNTARVCSRRQWRNVFRDASDLTKPNKYVILKAAKKFVRFFIFLQYYITKGLGRGESMHPVFSGNACCAKAITDIAQGNMQSLTVLYEQLGKQIYTLTFSILNNRADAEDAMQDTFLRVARYAKSFESGGNARAWVMAVARNAALDIERCRVETVPLESADEPAACSDDPAAECELRSLLSVLPEPEKQIVLMKTAQGFKYAEIAGVFGLTAEAVRKKYKRALQKLKNEYR